MEEIFFGIVVLSAFYGLCLIIDYISNKYKNYINQKKQVEYYKSLKLKKEDLDLQEEKLKNIAETIQQEINIVRKIADDNSQTSPWLAQKYADFWEMKDTNIQKYLIEKPKPALKSAEIVNQIKKEKNALRKENRELTYQLNFLTDTYPWLKLATQETVKNAIEYSEYIKKTKDNKILPYQKTSYWLSPEEYAKLSSSEKNQLALDRYLHRKNKSLWEIGISFERYVGYLCECRKFKVDYVGALKGFNDLGRDVVAKKDNRILVIQCKYWRKERQIYPKDIMYFYGTVAYEKYYNPDKKVEPIFATTTTLTPEAKEIAKILKIIVRENMDFNREYPCIKCNINKTDKRKIYHFPFDQQYDRIQIDTTKGECYVSTVEEAEALGFVKAKHHNFSTDY